MQIPYDSEKLTFTNGIVQSMTEELEYVELDILYLLDDFSHFSHTRMGFRPEKNTTLKVLFLHKSTMDEVQVLVGRIDDNTQKQRLCIYDSEDSEGQSIFTSVINFDYRLIDSLKIEGITTIDQLMENVPVFCLNGIIRQIFWEEFHHEKTKKERLGEIKLSSRMALNSADVEVLPKMIESNTSKIVV